MCNSSVTALDVVSDVPGIEVGRAKLLHQDALHGLSELVKTDSVDIAPADALITYFEQHLTAACHRTWIRLAARYLQASGTRAVVPLVTRAGG